MEEFMRTLCLLALFVVAPALLAQEWDPAKTRVFAVGVLSFQDKKLGTWPDEGRLDAVMIDELKKRGVPEENITFLTNKDATFEATRKKLDETLSASAEDETFIFYYAGHGARDFNDEKRPVSLVCYDSMPTKPATYWKLKDVVATIEARFKGSNVMLQSDCCHSGAFMEEVKTIETKKHWGVLVSVQPGSRSTGNWTYTQCLIDMYRGDSLLDADGSGSITFREGAAWLEAEMAFFEEQLSCSYTRGYSDETVMAKAGEKKPERVGERCEGEENGKWYKVKVLDAKDGKFFVHWLGWEAKWDAWVEPARLRAYKPEVYEGGTVVEVEWDGVWYPAKVKQARLGLHLVHYEGYPDADDEYVPRMRMRLPKKKDG
jgi:hypothetical protein